MLTEARCVGGPFAAGGGRVTAMVMLAVFREVSGRKTSILEFDTIFLSTYFTFISWAVHVYLICHHFPFLFVIYKHI